MTTQVGPTASERTADAEGDRHGFASLGPVGTAPAAGRPRGADDLVLEVAELTRERDALRVRADALERQAEWHVEAAGVAMRRLDAAIAEIAALRTSTSWRLTKPLRFASKSVSALKKGPAYWRHLYAVRAQAVLNWRRENGLEPTVGALTRPPMPVPQGFAPVAEGPAERTMSTPLTDRARRAYKRARAVELR